MIPPINAYVAPWKPLNNVTPFTYRDGVTYLEQLSELRKFVNTELIAYVNREFGLLGDSFEIEVNRVIDVVNEQLANQDASVADSISALETSVSLTVDAVNASLAAKEIEITENVDAQLAPVISDFQAAIAQLGNISGVIDANDAVFAGTIANEESATRIQLDNTFISAIKPIGTTKAAVQAALDSAAIFNISTVYLPRNVYTFVDEGVFVDGVSLVGETGAIITGDISSGNGLIRVDGNGATVENLIVRNTHSLAGCVAIAFGSNTTNVKIANNIIDGNERVQGVSINATGVKGVTVENNLFDGVYYGFLSNSLATDLEDVRISQNRFINIYGDPIELNHPISIPLLTPYDDAAKHFNIVNNFISAPNGTGSGTGFGVGIAGACHVNIIGNTFFDVRVRAIHIEDSAKHINISGNSFARIGDAAITECAAVYALSSSSDINISNNTIRDVIGRGIWINADVGAHVNDFTISNNTIKNCSSHGIFVLGITSAGDQNGVITNNNVTLCNGSGIVIEGPGGTGIFVIDANICKSNFNYGLSLSRRSGLSIGTNVLFDNSSGQIFRSSVAPIVVPRILGRGVANVPAGGTSTAFTLLSLGIRSKGILTVTAHFQTHSTVRLFDVSWDGTTFTATQISTVSSGSMGGITVTQLGGNLQATAFFSGGAAINAQFEAEYSGTIVI